MLNIQTYKNSIMTKIKAIKAGSLINGTGEKPVNDQIILIEGKKIKEIGPSDVVKIPSDAEVLDASTMTVMPGLIESHSHPIGERSLDAGFKKYYDNLISSPILPFFKSVECLRQLLEFGITTVRILHGPIPSAFEMRGEHLVALRTAVERGYFPSPRIVAAGCVFPTAGHIYAMVPPQLLRPGWAGADGIWEVRKQTRLCLAQDVDVIKLLGPTGGGGLGPDGPKVQGCTLEEVQVAVEEAHWKGIPVSAHAHGGPGLRAAIEGGVDSIEHGTYLCEDPSLFELMKEKGIYHVPTVGLRTHPRYGYLKDAKNGLPTPEKAEDMLYSIECSINSVKLAHKAGVKIAAGTDFMRFSISPLAYELEVYHKQAGLSTMEAIVSGTKTAAEVCNISNTGTLEPGKYADILVVDGDPLNDITVLQDREKIRHVYKEGRHEVKNGRINW